MSVKTAMAKKAIKIAAKEGGKMAKSKGSSVSKKDGKSTKKKGKLDQAYENFTDNRALSDVVVPLLGDVAHATGNIGGAWHSLLGLALQAAVSDKDNSVGLAKDLDIRRAENNMLRGKAAQNLSSAATWKIVGDTIANRMYETADLARARQSEKEVRDYQDSLIERGITPNNSYFDYHKKLADLTSNKSSSSGGNNAGFELPTN